MSVLRSRLHGLEESLRDLEGERADEEEGDRQEERQEGRQEGGQEDHQIGLEDHLQEDGPEGQTTEDRRRQEGAGS